MTENSEKFAILTSVYQNDDPSYMCLALDSILTDPRCEQINIYIHVDGEIGPDHEAVLNAYGSNIHKVVRSKKNIGLAFGLNKLIEHLGAEEFIFRMDLDDIMIPGRIDAQISFLKENMTVSLVGCQALAINEAGERIGTMQYPETIIECELLLTRQNPILHPTYCFRRSILLNDKIRYENYLLSEDLAFLINLSLHNYRFTNISSSFYKWRIEKNFFARRKTLNRGITEFKLYSKYIANKHPFKLYLYVFPTIRLILRVLPSWLSRLIYKVYRFSS